MTGTYSLQRLSDFFAPSDQIPQWLKRLIKVYFREATGAFELTPAQLPIPNGKLLCTIGNCFRENAFQIFFVAVLPKRVLLASKAPSNAIRYVLAEIWAF